MNAFKNHFSFEFLTGIRNRQSLLMNYLFPLGFYLVMGLVMTEIFPLYQEMLIPAMVTFAVLASTLLGIPDPLVSSREKGIFRNYKINGVPSLSILLVPALTTLVHLVIVMLTIAISAPLLFDALVPTNWINFVIVFFALAFACIGLSVLIGVISPSSRTTILWSQAIFLPSMLLGGLTIPHNMLPGIAQKFAQLLPSTHAMNAFNGLAMARVADFSPWGSVVVLVFGGLMAFGLALYLFSWDSHNSTRRGHPLLALLALVPYVVGIFLLK
ncbi:MAG: ABC transporter permease [Anaerolineaceae bacterium]|jgi:ABC-2 type transport system permease protein